MPASQPVPGTTVPAGSQVSPGGPLGTGVNAFNETASQFTVPAVGSTVVVNLNDASWVVEGQIIYVDQAGGGLGKPGILQVTVKNGNQLTLLNPQPPPAIPLATSSTAGLMAILNGLATSYVGGDNACHDLVAALAAVVIPSGSIIDFAGSAAPSGFVLCNGVSYPTAGSMAKLFAIIGYTYGGSGNSFNVPDCRGRSLVGAGQGSGLTNRALAATGGAESVVADLAAHTHGMDHCHNMDHYHTWPLQGSHGHALADNGHNHNVNVGYTSINYGTTSPGYAFYEATGGPTVSGLSNQVNAGISVYAANTPAGNTNWASQTNGAWSNTYYASQTNGAWANTGSAGAGGGHNNMQPFMALNKIIKI